MDISTQISALNIDDALKNALLKLVENQQQTINHQTDTIANQIQEIEAGKIEISTLKHLNADLRATVFLMQRHRFGSSSEAMRHNPNQALLFDSLAEDVAELENKIDALSLDQQSETTTPVAVAKSTAATEVKPKVARKPFPATFPRVDIMHDLDNKTCDACHGALKKIRDEVTEKLEFIPAKFIVNRHIYPQYNCPCCQQIKAVPAVPAIIQGSIAEASFWAYVLISKYVDHLPLYRIEYIIARLGLDIGRSVMSQWVGTIGVHLQPLVEALRKILYKSNCIHADETPIQQLDPKSGKTKQAYLWAYRSNDLEQLTDKIIIFDYHDNRQGKNAKSFLQQWQGHLMVDDYSGYKALFKESKDIIELGCMAHARRKFFDLYQANKSKTAEIALAHIAALYAIEAHCAEMSIADRKAYRLKEAVPRLAAYKIWLDEQLLKSSPSSNIGKALSYTARRFAALSNYAQTGHLPIDNNPVENSIRPIALGKKNWLFAGSKLAGERAANIQTLLGTAKLNGIEPLAWLRYVLEELPTCKDKDIAKLLPLAGFSASC